MHISRGILYFHSEKHQHNLRVATFIMFLSLVIEKTLSCSTASFNSGELLLNISFKFTDIVSILVYFSVSVLLALKANYTLLLIPDFFLLCVKLYTAATSLIHLFDTRATNYERISYLSKFSESILFSLFLILLFIGKLFHTGRVYSKNYPFVCMRLLIACFPITVLFEIIKITMDEAQKFAVVRFLDFARNIINEAFLDLPYFLLLMLLAFVPQNRYNR